MAVPTSAPRRRGRYTEQDLLRLRNDGRKYELVNGRLVEVPTGGQHGEIVAALIGRLYASRQPDTVLYSDSTGFRMRTGNIRSPDAAVMRRERLPEGRSPVDFADGAPDLAVEVVAPSESQGELAQKVIEYFDSGAREVWLLFPDRQQVYRYTAPLSVVILNRDDMLTGGDILPDFSVKVSELFE